MAASPPASSTGSWFSGIVRGRSHSVKMPNNSTAASAASDSVTESPINRKKQFRGVLLKYGPKPIQVCRKNIQVSVFFLTNLL